MKYSILSFCSSFVLCVKFKIYNTVQYSTTYHNYTADEKIYGAIKHGFDKY